MDPMHLPKVPYPYVDKPDTPEDEVESNLFALNVEIDAVEWRKRSKRLLDCGKLKKAFMALAIAVWMEKFSKES